MPTLDDPTLAAAAAEIEAADRKSAAGARGGALVAPLMGGEVLLPAAELAPAPRMLPAGAAAAVVTVPRMVSQTYLVFQVEVRAALPTTRVPIEFIWSVPDTLGPRINLYFSRSTAVTMESSMSVWFRKTIMSMIVLCQVELGNGALVSWSVQRKPSQFERLCRGLRCGLPLRPAAR